MSKATQLATKLRHLAKMVEDDKIPGLALVAFNGEEGVETVLVANDIQSATMIAGLLSQMQFDLAAHTRLQTAEARERKSKIVVPKVSVPH